MEQWLIWLIAGGVMVLLEFILPGGIIVFLGLAALVVGGGVYFGFITSILSAILTWFISSLIFMIFLRSLFMKYFEGDSQVDNVDEDIDLMGVIVEVVEDVLPHKEGRVRLRDSTWTARSDEKFEKSSSAIVCGRDGNKLVIKSI